MGNIVDISEVLLDAGLSDGPAEKERALVNTAITRAEAAVRRFLGYDPVQRQRTEYYPQQDCGLSGRSFSWNASSTHAYLSELADAASSDLFLRHVPIRSIQSVNVDQNRGFASSTRWTVNQDYWMHVDMLDDDGNKMSLDGMVKANGSWPSSAGTVRIVYTAGYSAAELHGQKDLIDATPILEAVVDESVRRMLKIINRGKKTGAGWTGGPLTSESLGDYSYSIDTNLMGKLLGLGDDLMGETMAKLQSFRNLGHMIAG